MNSYNEDFWKALDELVNSSEIVIDRPKGSAHPKFPDFIYPVDSCPHLMKYIGYKVDIHYIRYIFDTANTVRKDHGRNDRHSSIFCAADANRSTKPLSTVNDDLFQAATLSS